MSVILRDYQQAIITDARKQMARHKAVLIEAPTGAGKTVLASFMLDSASKKGKRCWFVVHRQELVEQTIYTFDKCGIPYGIVAAGWPMNPYAPIQICSIQTLANRVARLPKPDMIVWDECITGNSLLQTDVGIIRISDVVSKGATYVLSFNGTEVVWKKIQAWRLTGRKNIKRVTLSNGSEIKATDNHPIFTKSGWKTIGAVTTGEKILCLTNGSASLSSEPCSEIRQSSILISGQNPRASQATIHPSSTTGFLTKLLRFTSFAPKCGAWKTPDTEASLPAWLRLASRASEKLQKLSGAMALRNLPSRGWIASAAPESRGGIATMAALAAQSIMQHSTPKDTEKKELGLSQAGSPLGTDKQISTATKAGTFSSDFPVQQQSDCFRTLPILSPNQCDTSWYEITSIGDDGEDDVYDISVEETRCFFANGILVHNCHHLGAASWEKVMRAFPDAWHIGLSATPVRTDGKGLGRWFSTMVKGPSVRWLIDNGHLSDYRLFAPASPDLSGVHTRHGDYVAAELDEIMRGKAIVGGIVKHWLKHARGMRTIGFAPSIKSSEEYVAAFRQAGVMAVHLDGKMAKADRRTAGRAFADGQIEILFNVDLFGEGFDLAALAGRDVAIEAAILARPTQSLGLHRQQIGRSLRKKPRAAVILDHSGNTMRHGLPCEEIEWTLEDRKKKAKGDEAPSIPMRQCVKCYVCHRPAPKCPNCGYIYPIQHREVDVIEDDLAEVDVVAQRRKRLMEQGQAQTLDELIELGRRRGYKHPEKWAAHLVTARMAGRQA